MGSIHDDMQNAQSCSWWFGFLADVCYIMNILLTCVALFVCMLFLRNVFFLWCEFGANALSHN